MFFNNGTSTNTCWPTPENEIRGRSAIIWSVVYLVFTIITWIPAEILFQLLESRPKGTSITDTEVVVLCIFAFFAAFYSIIFIVYVYKFSVWIYYAVKEQSQYTSTEFAPSEAVTLGCVLGPFIDAIIFKDLFRKQNATLEKYNLPQAVLPKWIFTSIIVATALMIPTFFTIMFLPGRIFMIVLLTLVFALYIKTMKGIMANGRLLQFKLFDDMVERRAAEIAVQRENS